MLIIRKEIIQRNRKDYKNHTDGIDYFDSPIGLVRVCSYRGCITGLDFAEHRESAETNNDTTKKAIIQLDEYFRGKRKEFDLEVLLEGTFFQTTVWEKLGQVKYGQTASYKDIARMINNEKAVRAVGGANNKNPVAIIIPCHRVIGSDGSLIGYASGIDKKQWLLTHEINNR